MARGRKTSRERARRSPLRVLRKLVFYPFVAVAVVLAALSAALQFVPEDSYRPFALDLLNRAIPARVEIGGDLDIRVWPLPRLVVGGLSVAASHGPRPLFEAERAETAVRWQDLLRGRLVIGRIDLFQAALYMEVDADGDRNWRFSDGEGNRNWFALLPQSGSCEDCSVEYLDRRHDRAITWQAARLGLNRDGERRVLVDAEGQLQGMAGRAGGTLTALPAGDPDRLPVAVDLELALAGASGRLRGTAPDLREWRAGVFEIETRGLSGAIVEAFAPWPMPPIVTASLDARLDSTGEHLVVDRIVGAWPAGEGELAMTGTWRDPPGDNILDLEFHAAAVSTRSLAAAAEIDLEVDAAVSGTAALTGRGQSLILATDGLVVESGPTRLRGSGEFEDLRDGRRLALDLELTSDDLASVGAVMGREWPRSGPLRAEGRLVGPWRSPSLAGGRLQVSARGLRIDGRGSIGDVRRLRGLDLGFDAVVEDLEQAIPGELRSYLPAGTGGGSLDIRDREQHLEVSGSLSSDSASMAVEGSLAIAAADGDDDATWWQDLDLAEAGFDIDLSGETLIALAPWLEGDFQAVGPARASARLTFGPSALELTAITAAAGDSAVTGGLRVERPTGAGSVPTVRGHFDFSRLDLDALLPAADEDDGMMISDAPLPLSFVRRLDAEVEFRADWLRYLQLEFGDVAMRWVDSGSRSSVERAGATLAGGELSVSLAADVGTDATAVDLGLSLTGLNPELLPMFEKGDVVRSGSMDLDISVQGSGVSMRDVLTAGSGEVLLEIDHARLPRTGLNLISTDLILLVFRSLNPFLDEPDYYDVECGVVGFRIADGKAVADRSIGLLSRSLSIVGGGIIDLATEVIDFALKPKPREGIGLNISTLANLVHLGGTLERPRTQTNPTGILRSGAELGAAVYTGGLSLVLRGLFDRFTGGAGVCDRALDYHRAQMREADSPSASPPANGGPPGYRR